MRMHLLLILLLVGFSFGSDANYIISLKETPKVKSLHASALEHGRAHANGIKVLQAETLESQKDIVRELKSMGVEVKHQFWLTSGLAVYIPPEKLSDIQSLPEVERISPNGKVFLLRQNADPVIGAPYAWNLGLNGSGLKIAIVDTGINKTHPELVGRVINETDFHDDSYDGLNPADFDGHGTHVAGIAAGAQYGVARNASIINAKVFYCPYPGGCTSTQWTATTGDVIAAINWAVAQGAKVVSLSLGTNDVCDGNDDLAPTVEATVELGVTVVVAAGNSGPGASTIKSPGCDKEAVTVGATDNSDVIASFSSRGPTQDGRIKPDLTAPGVNINSTSKNGGYEFKSGTSMSTPFVSGVAILLLDKKPSLTPQMLKAVLMNSAKDLGSAGADNTYGAGRLNISEAIRQTDLVLDDNASSTQNKSYPIYFPNLNMPFKATLYWSEAWNGTEDLNLTLLSPNGTVFSNSNSNEVFEQVSVSQPQRGFWQLIVSSNANRTFALAFSQNSTFDLSVIPIVQNTTINSTVNFTIVLEHLADFNDSFQLNISGPFEYMLSNSTVAAPANSTINITLSVVLPANITAGNRTLGVTALSNLTNNALDVFFTVNVFSNLSLTLLPLNDTTRGYNLTIRVNATVPQDPNLPITNANLVAYLKSPSGANYSQSLSHSDVLQVGSFLIPLNSSVGVWNITVNSTNPFYNTTPVNSTFLVFGRLNATILANQSMIAGYPYALNSTIFDEVGNPVSANVSWYLNGTNFSNQTNFLFTPGASDIGNRTLSINATRQYYLDGLRSINLTVIDIPPAIANLSILPSHLLLPNETMNVSAIVTDNLNVSAVWANVTFPDASNATYFFLNSGSRYYLILNFSQNGNYSLNLFANDSLWNSANRSDRFYVRQPANISFNLNTTGLLRLLPEAYNETRNLTNASANIILPSGVYRLRLELANATFQFNNVLLENETSLNLSSQEINISNNEVFSPILAYNLSTSANFSSARVSFGYNSTIDSGKLSIFHCTDANYRNCTSISTSIDPAGRIAYADVQKFSIYALGLNKTFSAGILSYPLSSVKSGDSVSITVNVALDGAALSNANFSVSVGGTAVSITKAFASGVWTLSFTAPSLADGVRNLAVIASYGARSALDSKTVTYYTPAQQYIQVSGGGSGTFTYRNVSNATRNQTQPAQNKTEEKMLLEITDLKENVSITEGSEKIVVVSVRNSGREEFVTVSLSGIDPSLFFSASGPVNASETRRFEVLIKVPDGTEPGNYTVYANALVGGKIQASEPFLLEVVGKERRIELNESRIIAKASTLTKTVREESPVIQLDLITSRPELVAANYLVKSAQTGELIANYSESFFLEKSGTLSRRIAIPKNLTAGIYVIEAVLSYGGKSAKDITTFEALPSETKKPPGQFPYAELAVLLFALFLALALAYSGRKKPRAKKEEKIFLDAKKLPKGGFYVGMLKSAKAKAQINPNDLLLHMIVAGGTGSGKTVAVMDIVEGALASGVKVVVFDPTGQWTGFPKPAGREMLEKYGEFGMSQKENRGYPANIIGASNAGLEVSLNALPDGLTVFDMHKLRVKDLDQFIKNTINSIFASALPESRSLKYLVVYDEVHRSLPKYGGKKSYIALERACREFRKWGIGLVMLSQVLSDFRGAIRANIGTELQMRTKYEADIERVRSKYGAEYGKFIARLRIGEALIQNPEYNAGKPYLIQFRPLRHSEMAASKEELEKYFECIERAGELEKSIAKLKDKKSLELELNLAREKARVFAFRMAGTYLDSVEGQTRSMETD